MKLFLLAALLLAGASANQEAAPHDDVTADQSTDASRAVTYVQSHVTAHDDGYGHGPDEVHRHTVATTYHYPDYHYPAQHGGYAAAPVYGNAIDYAPGYGGYGHGHGGSHGAVGYGYGHGGSHGAVGYGPVAYGPVGYGPVGYGHVDYAH